MNGDAMFGRGLGFPMHVDAQGGIAWSLGEANIAESIRVILGTEPGERLFRPDFGAGLRFFLFQPNTVTTRHQLADRIRQALLRHEPRIQVESVDALPDAANPEAAIVHIHYRLVASQARASLSVTVQLGG